MVFGKDCATGINAKSPADVVEQLDNEEQVHPDEDDLENTDNLMGADEVQSMSCSEAPKGAQSQTQLEGSSKKKKEKLQVMERHMKHLRSHLMLLLMLLRKHLLV